MCFLRFNITINKSIIELKVKNVICVLLLIYTLFKFLSELKAIPSLKIKRLQKCHYKLIECDILTFKFDNRSIYSNIYMLKTKKLTIEHKL